MLGKNAMALENMTLYQVCVRLMHEEMRREVRACIRGGDGDDPMHRSRVNNARPK